jgi:hypothetical protein
MSTTKPQPLLIYIEDAQTVTRDKCRSGAVQNVHAVTQTEPRVPGAQNGTSGAACAVTTASEASCANDGDGVGMGCERLEITDVASEDRSARLGQGDDQGVNGRSALR